MVSNNSCIGALILEQRRIIFLEKKLNFAFYSQESVTKIKFITKINKYQSTWKQFTSTPPTLPSKTASKEFSQSNSTSFSSTSKTVSQTWSSFNSRLVSFGLRINKKNKICKTNLLFWANTQQTVTRDSSKPTTLRWRKETKWFDCPFGRWSVHKTRIGTHKRESVWVPVRRRTFWITISVKIQLFLSAIVISRLVCWALKIGDN